ncbi:MAG: M57 family metalloprotease [Candidatus Peribacteria bacterium]|nr:M57 family metalloprotease [Candidatus Peribacteria bacterium]
MYSTQSIIWVVWVNTGENNVAEALIPSGGYPGSYVRINSAFTGTWTAANKKWTMVHELGHTIGLAHANSTGAGESGSILVNIAECQDSNDLSVMRQEDKNSGFTTCDKKAYRYIYGLPYDYIQ